MERDTHDEGTGGDDVALFDYCNHTHCPLPLRHLQRTARQTTVTVKATAGNWQPGSKTPAHLAGKSIPGNYGFDPLSLGAPEGALAYYQQAELQHCRWAMMGVAGILIPDICTHAGVLNVPVCLMERQLAHAESLTRLLVCFRTGLRPERFTSRRRVPSPLRAC